jgi:hypothetical protein
MEKEHYAGRGEAISLLTRYGRLVSSNEICIIFVVRQVLRLFMYNMNRHGVVFLCT